MINSAVRIALGIGLVVGLSCTAVAQTADVETQLQAEVQQSTSGGSSGSTSCAGLPSHHSLQVALQSAQSQSNGGFGLEMWATVVNRDGYVCEVAFSGTDRGSQWPGSRAISAQKANTANAFSLPKLALSSADLYAAVQPGGTLYGLQASNPVDTSVAYAGPASEYGQDGDPMRGHRIGGINVFGGGLALYNSKGTIIGGIGVSGDTSCADHDIAWRTRHTLFLDYLAGLGVSEQADDNINYMGEVPVPSLANDFSHPICKIKGVDHVTMVRETLPAVRSLPK